MLAGTARTNESSPSADTSRFDLDDHLPGTCLGPGPRDEVHLMLFIVRAGEIDVLAGNLALGDNAKVGRVEDLGRVVLTRVECARRVGGGGHAAVLVGEKSISIAHLRGESDSWCADRS